VASHTPATRHPWAEYAHGYVPHSIECALPYEGEGPGHLGLALPLGQTGSCREDAPFNLQGRCKA